MRRFFPVLCFVLSLTSHIALSQVVSVPGPAGSERFGQSITILTNGNYVVNDPYWDNGSVVDVGAVYLYNGETHELISTLTGSSANDRVGSGVTALTNGNFVVVSHNWSNGAAINSGASTWCSGTSGSNRTVSISNSLLGSRDNDMAGVVHALPNGNYVVVNTSWDSGTATDVGAITWGNGVSGTSGVVSSTNSLIGSSADDQVGFGRITILANSNYVVSSYTWDNGNIADAGAATWCSGTTPTTGIVSASNSLVGSSNWDQVGITGIIALTNGNYVVSSPYWRKSGLLNVGAATWGNGSSGTVGIVSESNSLIGSNENDYIGGRIFPLTNGNYVVKSESWRNGSAANAGAATWGNGSIGIAGSVSIANSLVGTRPNDKVGEGYYGVVPLTNGNYVVRSPNWDSDNHYDAGAATWGNGTVGINGVISVTNSVIGNNNSDFVGLGNVTALTNGNYVINSYKWDSDSKTDVGAVTWCIGDSPTGTYISVANSLIGATAFDQIGFVVDQTDGNGVFPLPNGDYVVASPNLDEGSKADIGAVTWGDGQSGSKGFVSAYNSLVGNSHHDQIGSGGVYAAADGNYVVLSKHWHNTNVSQVGAATWRRGLYYSPGIVSESNSLVGTTNSDFNSSTITTLANGGFVIRTPFWNNGTASDAGAMTFSDGTKMITGAINKSQSLIGLGEQEFVGGGIIPFSDRNFLIISSRANSPSLPHVGAITLGSSTGISGTLSPCTSIFGETIYSFPNMDYQYNPIYKYMIVGDRQANQYSYFGGNPLASDNTESSKSIGTTTEVFTENCANIAAVTPTSPSPVTGSVTAKVYVRNTAATSSGQPYVRRHHDITPAANENTATGRITLYYEQSDFNDFNTNRGSYPALPTEPTDGTGKSAIRITQHHGTSTTGEPGSYTGWTGTGPATVLIDPDDSDIVWNSIEKRWEVSFSVTGFSGFFLHTTTSNNPLPVNLVSLAAKEVEGNALLQWKTTGEINASHFEVERSSDGKTFRQIGQVKATGDAAKTAEYSFTDTQFSVLADVVYYRLKSVDLDGSFSHSRMVSLAGEKGYSMKYVYPNPVKAGGKVILEAAGLTGTLSVTDLTGRTVNVLVRTNSNGQPELNLKNTSPGLYLVKYQTEVGWQTKKLIVE